MIAPHDISVVVQGPCGPHLEACLISVRQRLPQAEIVLATWADSVVSPVVERTADRILFVADPGPVHFTQVAATPGFAWADAPTRNINRQIASTRAGLQAAQRSWALKLRSDLHLQGTGFLSAAAAGTGESDSKWRIGENRIVTTDVMSPDRTSMLHFAQDFAYFGRTADLRRLFSVPLVPVAAAATWTVAEQARHFAVYAEQYIWRNYVGRLVGAAHTHAWECSPASVNACRRLFAANLVPLTLSGFGIDLLKYPTWKTAFYQEKSANWCFRASTAEWKSWQTKQLEMPGDALAKAGVHTLYLEFIRSTFGELHFLHREINCANNALWAAFQNWLAARGQPLPPRAVAA